MVETVRGVTFTSSFLDRDNFSEVVAMEALPGNNFAEGQGRRSARAARAWRPVQALAPAPASISVARASP